MTAAVQRRWLNDARELVVTLAIRTRSETNMREVWQARHRRRKQQRTMTRWVLTGAILAEGVAAPCVVTLTRLAPSSGLDDDNLRGAFKAIRDGVADALGVTDRDPRVTWQYDQRRSKPRQWGVEVRIRVEGVT